MIAKDYSVRALACINTQLANEASHRPDAYPTSAAALGRALTGGILLGGW